MEEKYTIHYCWDGRKSKVACKYEYADRSEYRWDKRREPYDIIDEDDHNVWFDYGDE